MGYEIILEENRVNSGLNRLGKRYLFLRKGPLGHCPGEVLLVSLMMA